MERACLLGFAWVVGGRDGCPSQKPEIPAGGIVLILAHLGVLAGAPADADRRPPAGRARSAAPRFARRLDLNYG
jgi:hypothetical protein